MQLITKSLMNREQADSCWGCGGLEWVEGLSKKEKEKELMDTDNNAVNASCWRGESGGGYGGYKWWRTET